MRFGPFELSDSALTRDGVPLAVGRRGLAVLAALATAAGPVTREKLIEAGWPGLVIEQSNLAVQVATLRKAMGKRADGRDWIATVARVGYRLLPADGRESPPAVPLLAVLPFENLSGDAAEDYFVDGVVEDIITALSRFRSFAVIARNSSFVYRGRVVDIRHVAGELGADYVLEGSMRMAGNRLRIAAQLIRGSDGAHLWARNFDGELGEIFDFQDRIAEDVVGMVEPSIQQAEIERSRRERPGSVAAYDLYLRALPKHAAMTPADNFEAMVLLERALVLAPDYAVAMKVAIDVLSCGMTFGWRTLGGTELERCNELTERALTLSGSDATVIAQCAAVIVTINHDYGRGMELAERALALNPNNCDVLSCVTACTLHCGKLETAIERARRALHLSPGDPLNEPFLLCMAAHAMLPLGEYEDAVILAERGRAIRPSLDPIYWMLIAAYVALGRMDEARQTCAVFRALRPGATVAHVTDSQPSLHPERIAPIVVGLRAVGLPER